MRRERSERSVRTQITSFSRLLPNPAIHHCSPTKGDAASPLRQARRGGTPHLLGSSLIAICDRASKGKYHNETPTVHKTPSLPLRPMLRELQPPVPDSARQDVSPPQGKTGPFHGDAASSRVTPKLRRTSAALQGVRCSATDNMKRNRSESPDLAATAVTYCNM